MKIPHHRPCGRCGVPCEWPWDMMPVRDDKDCMEWDTGCQLCAYIHMRDGGTVYEPHAQDVIRVLHSGG